MDLVGWLLQDFFMIIFESFAAPKTRTWASVIMFVFIVVSFVVMIIYVNRKASDCNRPPEYRS